MSQQTAGSYELTDGEVDLWLPRNMLVKARDSIFFLRFSENMDYIGELSRREVFPTVVPYNDPEDNGQAVAWNEQGTGFYTLPEGPNPVLKFHPVNITEDSPVG